MISRVLNVLSLRCVGIVLLLRCPQAGAIRQELEIALSVKEGQHLTNTASIADQNRTEVASSVGGQLANGSSLAKPTSVFSNRTQDKQSHVAREPPKLQKTINANDTGEASSSERQQALLQRSMEGDIVKKVFIAEPESGSRMTQLLYGSMILNAVLVVVALLGFYTSNTSPDDGNAAPEGGLEGEDSHTNAQMRRLRQQRMQLLVQRVENQRQLEEIAASIKEERRGDRSIDDIQREAQENVRSADFLAERGIIGAFAYATPLLMQGQRIQQVMTKRVDSVMDKARQVALEEVHNLGQDVRQALDIEGFDKILKDTFSDDKVPTLAILMSSLFANMQIKAAHIANLIGIVQNAVFSILSLIAVPVEVAKPCHQGTAMERYVLAWFCVDGLINLFCIAVSITAFYMTKQIIATLDKPPPPVQDAGDPSKRLRYLVDYYSSLGVDALIELDRFRESTVYKLNRFVGIVSVFMLIIGTDLCFNTNWDDCTGTSLIALIVLRLRIVLYLMLFIPMFLANMCFITYAVLGGDFQLTLLDIAAATDASMQLGFPLVTIAVHSMLVRTPSDMLDVQLRRAKRKSGFFEQKQAEYTEELLKNEKEHEAAKAQLEKLRAAKEELNTRTSEEQHEDDEQKKAELLDQAEVFFKTVNTSAMTRVKAMTESLEQHAQFSNNSEVAASHEADEQVAGSQRPAQEKETQEPRFEVGKKKKRAESSSSTS